VEGSALIAGVVALMTMASVAGLAFAFLGGDNSKSVNKRVARISEGGRLGVETARGGAAPDTSRDRRKQVQDTLKELEEKAKLKKKRLTLRRLIEQAGLQISVRSFYMMSIVAGAACGLVALVTGQSLLISALIGFAVAFGAPRWLLFRARGKRQQKFTMEFSNALDVIVRGVKSGLPVNECLKIIATESPSPVREEFEALVEGQRIGVTLEQGLARMYERMPLAEVNFFGIVLVIQQKTGGNLAEALNNLALVLRGRKMLKGKIEALTSEARTSSMILLALPFMVGGGMWFLSGDYMQVMVETPMGKLLLMIAGAWLALGTFIMNKMADMKV